MAAALEIGSSSLPDIAADDRAAFPGRIERVGMEGIDLPVRIRREAGPLAVVPARADVFVSLDDPDARGIHMSRLFLALQEILAKEELCPATLRQVLAACVVSHTDVSRSGHVAVRFDHLVRRPALKSEHAGWKSYPVEVSATMCGEAVRTELSVRVPYSSTCPCSTALSRELVREAFLERFEGVRPNADQVADWLASRDGMVATPHSQRSFADVRIVLQRDAEELPVLTLVDEVESALGTPVQAAVKREDEQAFAALNGSNQMFCEDAARRIRHRLERDPEIADYRVRVCHEESLHPHDAVAMLVKGVQGGLQP